LKEKNNVKKHCGRGAIIMKLNQKVLKSSLVVMLALGLGGCAANSATTTHKSHEAQSAQVVKQNHKKASDKAAAKESTSEQKMTSNNSSSASTVSKQASSQAASSTVASTRSANASAVAAPAKAAQESSSSVKENQNIQLGLGDVASWTDAQGVTHHVDSDGMDRYTAKGSSQVQYQDWSGQLPSNAVVSHH
jgi:flagellar biosynthesis GTPase FlhF